TDLLLEEAGNDPIKKAELIKDIVASIAKIPDAIKRSVFTKECASLTQTNEQLLVNELNKVIGKNISKSRKSTYNNDVPFPTENEYNDAPPEERIEQPDTKPKQGDEFQEKDIVRILIEAGSFIMDEETGLTTSEFILENIADLLDYFDSKDYVQIVQECMAEAEKGNALTPSYFINHKDSKIRDLTMGILTSPYEYSFNWDKKLEMPLQSQKKPEENFTRDTIESVNRFKLHKVMKIMKENQDKLKSIEKDNVAQMMKILKVQQKLMEMKKELAAYFGSVVLK
ncbi:MAG: DNA primase, partial [Saprospiraceae bacterium]